MSKGLLSLRLKGATSLLFLVVEVGGIREEGSVKQIIWLIVTRNAFCHLLLPTAAPHILPFSVPVPQSPWSMREVMWKLNSDYPGTDDLHKTDLCFNCCH
jgi:hypothetical protein